MSIIINFILIDLILLMLLLHKHYINKDIDNGYSSNFFIIEYNKNEDSVSVEIETFTGFLIVNNMLFIIQIFAGLFN